MAKEFHLDKHYHTKYRLCGSSATREPELHPTAKARWVLCVPEPSHFYNQRDNLCEAEKDVTAMNAV